MNKQTQAITSHLGTLAEDASALMAATADVAGDKVAGARKRLTAALERGKEIYGQVQNKTVQGVKAADKVVRNNPYAAIGVALGIGAVIGYVVASRCARNCD
jgi:ElaB/YqjD/DUF883 family membrane-anchored ribosome-binding protein